MNPGLVVKLRPAGPWRIGPDSGARNRVDTIYHSDSLYSAVTGALARLGGLEDWLDATARAESTAVCFSSCFPFLDEISFVVPPRTMWPPKSPSLMAGNVRWKSARFVPLTVVQALLVGQPLNRSAWSVDGPSACLVPAGKPGPFRTSVRWSAAVDRLSGASERHAMACLEFRPGAGLWTVVSFASEAARDRWTDPVKAAFRLLADTGFGGERSRGWGRSEAPEFAEGSLPELISGTNQDQGPGARSQVVESTVEVEAPVEAEPSGEVAEAKQIAPPVAEPLEMPAEEIASEEQPNEAAPEATAEVPAEPPTAESEPVVSEAQPDSAVETEPESLAPGAGPPAPAEQAPKEEAPEEAPSPLPPAPGLQAHWLLSLFTPGPADTVDWARGHYLVLSRGGRIESPVASGELKKQVRMVAEGSVLYAGAPPSGTAADVAPEGFAHPVFRAGFAMAIPLPEVH
jgi:CRISPR type III-A-associated RAMP protein Csm4